ncbi:four helix bundle protein [Myroides sp. DW712]|uniref:four helix bundle protein n=1 Tax=Myroides sp. DW712 TaxID=3389800 RepID=UPI00397C30F9
MYTYYFERMDVWQNARALNKTLYKVTTKYPSEEKFGLVSQIRRATASIAANIAEGISRLSAKEKLWFLNIAYSSAIEVVSFLVLSFDLTFISEEEYHTIRDKIAVITSQIKNLCTKIKGKLD